MAGLSIKDLRGVSFGIQAKHRDEKASRHWLSLLTIVKGVALVWLGLTTTASPSEQNENTQSGLRSMLLLEKQLLISSLFHIIL